VPTRPCGQTAHYAGRRAESPGRDNRAEQQLRLVPLTSNPEPVASRWWWIR